jgi:hypothetical protein
LNEGKVVSGEPVIARCNPAAVLDLVEEALDQVPSAVEVRAEADRVAAIAPWWDVGPSALLGGECSNPIRIISSVGQQHCFRLQAREKFAGKPVVMRLTGCQREPDRQAIGIDHRMNLAGQPAS